MKVIIYLLLGFALISCKQQNSGSELENQLVKQGFVIKNLTGSDVKRATKYGIDGKYIIEEGFLRNGRKNGIWVTYYENYQQRLKSVCNYVDDVLEGTFLNLDYMSRADLSTRFENGKLEGFRATYRLTTPIDYSEYKNGKLDGTFRAFNEYGMLKRQAVYQNGELNGPTVFFDNTGNKETAILEFIYKNGTKVSERKLN